MSAAIALEGLTKTFGGTRAVDALDLTVPAGSIYGFIGPNGAGKTTTIRMLMSILLPDSGRLEVLGHATALEAKDRIGYLPEDRGVYKSMRVGAYLKFIARLKGVDDGAIPRRIEGLLERLGLPGVLGKHCDELSKGMQQKIQFAAAVINEPELLILDEPFSGLDPVNMRLLHDLIIAEHERGATILFSTHVMPQAEDVCDHIVMMHDGRKVLDDPIAAIRGQFDRRTVVVEPLAADADKASLEPIAGVEHLVYRGGCFELHLAEGVDPAAVMQEAAGAMPVARIELKRPRLEDIFVRLVAGESADEAEALITALNAPTQAEASA